MSNSTGNSHGSNAGGGGGGGGGGGSGSNFGSIGFGTFSIGANHGGSMISVGSNASSHGGTSSNEMASHSFESRIDKMRRFISSPLTRRKSTSQASTESAPPLSTTPSSKNLESHHSNKIFGTPIEKLTHQRSFNEMSSSSICSSSTHLSASSYCTMRSMSTSGLPGNPFSSPSSSSSLSSSTINMGDPMICEQASLCSSSRKVDSEQTVPFVITRLCHYIEDNQGLMQEGLFRTSGNARLIEKLKTSFDSNGDAPLETEGDIPSAAALLKLFLRELPVPLIPQSIHCLFLDTVQDTLNKGSLYNKDAFIGRLKMLVQNLPDENYFLLKYLSRFLHQVARHETYNRMNPSSLGIIFGPNIFRVAAEDYKGLREQSLTNQVVTFFITDYEAIFGKDSPDNEESTNLLTNQDQHSLDQTNQLTLEETRKLEGNAKDKVIIVSIESDDLHQMTGKHQGESSICSLSSSSSSPSNKTIMTKEDDVSNLDNVSAKAAEISLSGDDHYTPLQIDIPPIDCEHSDSSSISPNTFVCSSISPCPVDSKEYLLSIDSSESTATLPTITPKKSQHQSSEGFKRKDRKSVLSSSSPVMRSSSEERKPFNFPDQMESNQANQDVRRCNSYQDVSKDGDKQEPFLSDQQQQTFKSNNLSSDSVTQSPRPKRRETESVKARLSRSTLSFECRPTTLDLSGRSNSMESKSEPMIRNKSSHIYTENSSSKPIALNEQSVEENKSKYIPLSFSKSYSKGSQQTKTETSHPNAENRQILSCQSSQQPDPDLSRASSSSSSKIPHTPSSLHSSLPQIDLNALHKNAEGESAMVSDLRYSWSAAIESLSAECLLETGDDNADDDDDTSETQSDPRLLEGKSNEPVQNAAIQILRRRNTYEAPLSPSAYRGFLGQRAPHLDHTIPPSPPGEQEQHFHGHKASYNNESQAVKEAKRKIHNLKRRLKQFEKDFEKETGYRPSHEQKMKSDVAQPILFELNKFRKILRDCKEDARLTLEFYEGVFNEMQRSLKERRYFVGRPETIEDMSIDQIFEEKLDLQKSLLKYESVFGRPSRKEDRIVMKPLYDRYRTIRNLVAKIPKNKVDTDLQPILENVAMNFASPSHSPGSSVDAKDESDEDINNNNPKKLDKSKAGVKGKKKDDDCEDDEDEDEEEEGYDQENSNNNANLNSNNVNSDDNNNQVVVDNNNPSKFELSDSITRTQPRPEATHSIKVKESSLSRYTKVSALTGEKLTVPTSSHKLCHNLHELPPSELVKELAVVRREKNELRKIIRSFEDEFHRNHGRKVNDLEKSQLESVYTNYKACKKKLRLLEVFIEKYEKRKMDS